MIEASYVMEVLSEIKSGVDAFNKAHKTVTAFYPSSVTIVYDGLTFSIKLDQNHDII